MSKELREFWLWEKDYGKETYDIEVYHDDCIKCADGERMFKVIEYSAYETLAAKVKRYEESLEKISIRSMSMYVGYEDMIKDFYQIARAALNQVEGEIMSHESRCIEFPCTCVTILRDKVARLEKLNKILEESLNFNDDKIASLEKKIKDGLSCCCSSCSKHNQTLNSEIKEGIEQWRGKNDTL